MPTSPEANMFFFISLLKSRKLNLEIFKLEIVQHLGRLYRR